MHSSGKTLVITLLGLCALGLAATRPAAAQNLVYTLNNVTFSDGAVAYGFFNFNPTAGTFGTFDVTTTNGLNDSLIGGHFTTGMSSPSYDAAFSYYDFSDTNFPFAYLHNFLALRTVAVTTPGIYSLIPAYNVTPTSFGGSGEYVDGDQTSGTGSRGIIAGSFIVTSAAAVPESSTTISLGLLLTLGFGGAAVATRKKKAAAF